ncbi:hypothetical protein TgHK011_005196 [Trichoderma gracile]|nr:hypothetical protein TgHK011_005196 [Trichoderma gracile]
MFKSSDKIKRSKRGFGRIAGQTGRHALVFAGLRRRRFDSSAPPPLVRGMMPEAETPDSTPSWLRGIASAAG